LTIPDPEHATEGETEVEITDLDSSKVSGKSTRRRLVPSFRARAWMSVAVIAGVAVLAAVVMVSVLHLPKATRVTLPPVRINYPVSLSVVDGICYASSPNGVVSALRVSDGLLLWRHAGGTTGEESATVVDGVIYLSPLLPFDSTATTVTVDALRASDGSPLWSRTFPTDAPAFFQLTVVNKVVYIRSAVERIDALRTSDGSLLWHYTSRSSFVSLPSVADGIVYAGTVDGHLSALRASDGFLLWTYTSHSSPQPLSPNVVDSMVYLNLQGGGMDVLRADTGVVLWRYTPRVPALQLLPLPLITNVIVYALTQDGHLYALRASDGFTVWRVALQATDLLPPLIGTAGVIYVGALDGSVDALRESDGFVLWRHQGGEEGPASITVAQGAIYLAFPATTSGVNIIGSITVLRASDGFVLWHYTPQVSARQLSPVEADGLVLIASQDGSIDALHANSGALRWHRAMNS
jgi:outer membrane protein assembly factor BamB